MELKLELLEYQETAIKSLVDVFDGSIKNTLTKQEQFIKCANVSLVLYQSKTSLQNPPQTSIYNLQTTWNVIYIKRSSSQSLW